MCDCCNDTGVHEAHHDGADVEVYCMCFVGQSRLLKEDTTGYAAYAIRNLIKESCVTCGGDPP